MGWGFRCMLFSTMFQPSVFYYYSPVRNDNLKEISLYLLLNKWWHFLFTFVWQGEQEAGASAESQFDDVGGMEFNTLLYYTVYRNRLKEVLLYPLNNSLTITRCWTDSVHVKLTYIGHTCIWCCSLTKSLSKIKLWIFPIQPTSILSPSHIPPY